MWLKTIFTTFFLVSIICIVLPLESYANCNRDGCFRQSDKIPIHVAVRGANLEEVKNIISSGEDVNERDSEGVTALSLAILSNQTKMTKYLLDNGANPNSSKILLTELIKKGDIKTIDYLLNLGAKIDGPLDTMWPDEIPLYAAIRYHKNDIALMLIRRGANVNIEPKRERKDYNTALGSTSDDVKMLPILKALLDAGADPNRKSINGLTPLHWAATTNNVEAIRLLLKKGSKIDVCDDYGRTPVMNVFSGFAFRKNKTSELQALKAFIDGGIDVNWVCEISGAGLLHYAINEGTIETIKYLIKSKVDVNLRDKQGNTPLGYAAKNYNPVVAELLLANGANPRIKNKIGQDPIYIALNNPNSFKKEAFIKLFTKYKFME